MGDSNGLVSLQKADATVEFVENVEVEKEVPADDLDSTGARWAWLWLRTPRSCHIPVPCEGVRWAARGRSWG